MMQNERIGLRALAGGASLALAGMLAACAAPENVACYIRPTTFAGSPGSMGNGPMEMFTRTGARWCGFSLIAYADNRHSTRATITEQPTHGLARVRRVKIGARAEYRPDPGFVGVDGFTAAFFHPDYDVKVRVVVRPGVPPLTTASRQ